jgi:hypothetical protein
MVGLNIWNNNPLSVFLYKMKQVPFVFSFVYLKGQGELKIGRVLNEDTLSYVNLVPNVSLYLISWSFFLL